MLRMFSLTKIYRGGGGNGREKKLIDVDSTAKCGQRNESDFPGEDKNVCKN